MKKEKNVIAVIVMACFFNFSVPSYAFGPAVLPGESRTIDFTGSTVLVDGLTDQDNLVTINGRSVLVQKDGSFFEEVIVPVGETEIIVSVQDPKGRRKSYHKKIQAKPHHLFLTGLADGTLNFTNASAGLDLKRDGKSVKDGFRPGGKISYYLRGKAFGRFLIKSAVDTDKSTQDKLFTHIDPDEYYPIYGDRSTVVYDVNSQGKFFAQIEADESGAVFGNYQTQIGDDHTELIQYHRTLYGGKAHFKSKKRTIYGDPYTQATGFIAEQNQEAGHEEFLATGTSLYYLSRRNIVQGSEQVSLVVRDKISGSALYSVSQAHDADYEMKYDEGRILFKRPVQSIAQSDTIIDSAILGGNPVYVVVNYEFKNQDAFQFFSQDLNKHTGGFRASQQLGDHVRTGVTYIQERKDGRDYQAYGGDGTVKIGNFTKVDLEIAKSRADSTESIVSYNGGMDNTSVSVKNLERGIAARIKWNTSLGEYFGKSKEFLDLSGYWQNVGEDFAVSDSLFEAGTRKMGIDISHRLNPRHKLRAAYRRNELNNGAINPIAWNQITAKRVQDVIGQWIYTQGKTALTSEYLYREKGESLSSAAGPGSDHILGEQIQYDYSDALKLYGGQQVSLTGDWEDTISRAGFSRKLPYQITFNGEAAAAFNGDNSVLTGFEREVAPGKIVYVNHQVGRTALDGKRSVTSYGSNTQVSEKARLRTERQFVTSDSRGTYTAQFSEYEHQITPQFFWRASYERSKEQTDYALAGPVPRDALSTGILFVMPDRLKVKSDFEYRNDSDSFSQYLTDTQGEYKLTRDIFLFGEYEASNSRESLNDNVARIDKKQIALAYRPVRFDRFNALVKYIRFTDERPDNLLNPENGIYIQNSTSDVFAGEFAFDLPWKLQWVEKLAYKKADILAVDNSKTVASPADLEAILSIHRLNYHLMKRLDAVAEYRFLRQHGSEMDQNENGALVEFVVQIIKGIGIGAGYNFTHFSEDLTASDQKSAQGFFVRLQGKY